MPYVYLTASTFRTMFPEFASLTDPVIDSALSEASRQVDTTWLEDDFQRAQGLYAAHLLKLQSSGGGAASGGIAGLSSVSIGPMSFQFAQPSKDSADFFAWLTGTSYGARYAHLLQVNHPPVVVI